ncbi:MAG TPA: hypothetical protein VG407_17570 [Caulobacteraceae bacterium]|jgi:hypothetical protein|nr:hypothetical protein [Caulobacteraceae bacterium]
MARWFVLPVVLACLAGAAAPAAAKIMRFQQQGETAFVYHIPDDWTANREIDSGAETLRGPGPGGGLIALAIVGDGRTLADIGASCITSAGGTPVAPQRTLTVSGKEALYYVEPGVSGGTLDMKLLVVRVDATHVGMAMELTSPHATPEQDAVADAVVDSIRVSPPDMSFGS